MLIDSSIDIVANVFGMGVGYFAPSMDAAVYSAAKWGNYIPGPADPAGNRQKYGGNPSEFWK